MKQAVTSGTKLKAVGTRGVENSLTAGRVYTVEDIMTVSRPSVLLRGDRGKLGYFNLSRFEVLHDG